LSETEKPSIFAPLSHGQSNDASQPSILTPQFDPYHKTDPGALVNTPPVKK